MWLCFSVCLNVNDFTGLDLTFLSYNMWRLIITKCYENLKWILTMKVQRATRHFAILPFCYICAHLILKFVLKFETEIFQFHRGNFICIFHPAVMNYNGMWKSALSLLFFGVWKPVFNIISLLFLWFPSLCQLHRRLTKGFLQD